MYVGCLDKHKYDAVFLNRSEESVGERGGGL